MHRARAALAEAAAEFRAGEPQGVAKHPEQRHVGTDVDVVTPAIYIERDHGKLLGKRAHYRLGREKRSIGETEEAEEAEGTDHHRDTEKRRAFLGAAVPLCVVVEDLKGFQILEQILALIGWQFLAIQVPGV